jgi:hypothetical protein
VQATGLRGVRFDVGATSESAVVADNFGLAVFVTFAQWVVFGDVFHRVSARHNVRRGLDGFIFAIVIFSIFGIREIVIKVREHKK